MTQTNAGNLIRTALLCLLLLLCAGGALAESDGNLYVFDDAFMKEHGLVDANGARLYIQDMDWDGDTCYAYLTDMGVYTYTPGGEPEKLCTLPPAPENFYARVDGLTDEDLELLHNTVTYISVWDGTLYGYNVYSGRWGAIDGEGVHWRDSRLNFSCLFHEDSFFPDRIANSFMTDDALYVLADSPNEQGEYVYAVFAFGLEDGTSERYDCDGLLGGACRGEKGELLLLTRFSESEYGTLSFNMDSGESFPMGAYFGFQVQEDLVGGLAYDISTDTIYVAANDLIYASESSAEYEPFALVDTSLIMPETHAWALSGGRYAVRGDELCIRGKNSEEIRELTIAGGLFYPSARDLYKGAHSDVRLNETDDLDQQTIIDYLLTGDETIDVYSMPLNYAFNLIKEKGLAVSMSGSEVIEADAARMDEQVQSALRDAQGNIVAYPAGDRVELANYGIHEGYWRMAFGDRPLPTTFEEVLDAWIEWEENDLIEEYPMLGFEISEGFSYENWVRRFITIYIRQHDADGEPNLGAPELRTVLEKLARLAEVRQQHGRGISGESDGDRALSSETGDTAFIFNLSSQVAMEGDDHWVTMGNVYDQYPGDVTWLPLTFEKDAKQYTDASMYVYFINPHSWHKEEALQFIECMTNPRAIPRLYYAVHPDMNEPLENEDYEEVKAWYERQCEEYRAGIKTAKEQDKDSSDLERQLSNYENWLASDEGRWEISQKTIDAYRQMVAEKPLNLHMTSPYLYAMTIGESSFVNTLCGQYAQGGMPLDPFLQKLSSRLNMITLEDSGSAGAG